jgi:excisionase family DNA binding protein
MADITTKEASEKYGLSPSYFRYLVKKDLVRGRKSGGTWLLDEASLKRYLARPRKPGPKPKRREALPSIRSSRSKPKG